MPGPPRGTASRHHTTWTPLHATLQHRTKKDAPGPSIPAPACTRDEDSLTGGAAASRRVPRAPDAHEQRPCARAESEHKNGVAPGCARVTGASKDPDTRTDPRL